MGSKKERRTVRQFAALPWRATVDGVQVLMITSRGRRRRPMLPKGNAIEGKSEPESAEQEALEEAGVVGLVSNEPIGRYRYSKDSDDTKRDVTVYPLKVNSQLDRWPEEGERERTWVKLSKAAKRAGRKSLGRVISAIQPKQLAADSGR